MFIATPLLYAQSQKPSTQTSKTDTTSSNLVYPFNDQELFDYPDEVDEEPLYLEQPSNIKRELEYDPITKQYIIVEKIGDITYRPPKVMNLSEYVEYDFDQAIKNYWRTRKDVEEMQTEEGGGLIPQLKIESEVFDNIFGGSTINIRPKGYVEVSFGLESNYVNDPDRSEKLRRTTTFDFDQQINLSVTGKIGDKVDMNVGFNSEATFDYENKMNISYTGKEDEIIRKIEAGNVSLPLNGTLIQGGTNLFGIKTEMQFGKLNLTTIISQSKGESTTTESEGGSQTIKIKNFDASDYDENRHFFLSKYFREKYDKSMSTSPVITSKITISKIEVWVTNTSQDYSSSRDIVGFVDLGEQQGDIYNSVSEFQETSGLVYPFNTVPNNGANGLYSQLITTYSGIRTSSDVTRTLQSLSGSFDNGVDWERVDQARKLDSDEYTVNEKLGYISLKSALNSDEVLAVAYSITVGDTVLQVGEFSSDTDSPNTLILKLLKGTTLAPSYPTWDLMMKNIYNLGATDISSEDFDFNIVYKNDSTTTKISYFPEGKLKGKTFLRILNLDNADEDLDYVSGGDGLFDFVDGYTIDASTGRIIFPVVEPFGSYLSSKLESDELREKYVFQELYDSTKTVAEEDLTHDKYYFSGSYKGSSTSDISLNSYNLSEGSVVVTAGGVTLTENVDYVVDYSLGKVTIINSALIEAGTEIQVSSESEDVVSSQRKSLVGTYGSYKVNDNLNLGGTMMYYNERPTTSKVDYGEEPVSNLMLGFDFQYHKQSKFLTDLVNLLPFVDTKAESSISMEGEIAKLVALNTKSTNNTVYLDDFEAAETSYSLITAKGWSLASTPQGQSSLFPEANLTESLDYGKKRAKLAWYSIDPIFTTTSSMPSYMKEDLEGRSNHYTRDVSVLEIYPDKEISTGSTTRMTILNLSYFPKERGPYNYDTEDINSDGTLADPDQRWGGVMREMQTTDFEAANIGYIEFWLLDPYIYDEGSHKGGDLYFDLGNISEDILKDSRKAFENGLPSSDTISNVDTTVWGRVSTKQLLTHAFSSTDDSRQYQDIGLDGLNDSDEQSFFKNYLEELKANVSSTAFTKAEDDPSSDDYHYYRGSDYDDEQLSIIERYKKYNNMEGNSPTSSDESYSTSGTDVPDIEDINDDNTLSETETYYQYKVSLNPTDMVVGENYITEKATRSVKLANGEYDNVNWYKFKIPIKDYESKIGSISGFSSIRFMRMFMTGFSDSVTLRFATLNLVRSDWVVMTSSLAEDGVTSSSSTEFDVSSIGIEEEGNRDPINYILPPDIEQEDDISSTTSTALDEQSMLFTIKDLVPGDARAVYKDAGIDIRQYEKIKMDVHAEALDGYELADNELSLFIRLGSDEDNYYEYEIPLTLTPEPTGSYSSDNTSDRYIVWPDENRLNVDLSIFTDLKEERDALVRKTGSTVKKTDVYSEADETWEDGKNTKKIKGNPTLAEVDQITIGIRNPSSNSTSKSAEIWVDELRLYGHSQSGGWASTGNMSVQLADLGSLTLAGSTESVGWGNINESTSERNLEATKQIDFSTTLNLGKLVPQKIGLNAPFYYAYSQSVATPEYDPGNSDIALSESLSLLDSQEAKDSLLAAAQEVVTTKSLNLTNVSISPVRKNKDRKVMPYDIENFAFTYSQTEKLTHDYDVERYYKLTKKGALDYNFSTTPKTYEPFKRVKFLNNKYLRIIKDFNFCLLPSEISFNTDLDRSYIERQVRNNTNDDTSVPMTVSKDFDWDRAFVFKYSPTRALTIDFTNQMTSKIDELDGVMNKDSSDYELMRQEIINNLKNLGRPTDYEHTLNVRYTTPINKLPLLDWTSSNISYQGRYTWTAASELSEDADTLNLGNVITNGKTLSFNLSGQLTTLYNKVPYFKRINEKYQSLSRGYGSSSRVRQQQQAQQKQQQQKQQPETEAEKRTKEVKYTERKVSFKAGIPKSIFHKLGTEEVKIAVISSKGDTITGESTVINENRINFKTDKNITDAKVVIIGTRDLGDPFAKKALDMTTRILLGVRSVSVSYNNTGSTSLPGFLPTPYMFGGTQYKPEEDAFVQFGQGLAPTIPFLMGWQDENFGLSAANRGWVTTDDDQTDQYLFKNKDTYTFSAQIEPIPNVRIDLSGSHSKARNVSSYLVYNGTDAFTENSRVEAGTFDMTIMTLKTSFLRSERIKVGEDQPSELYNKFLSYRQIIMNRLNTQRKYSDGEGYSQFANYDDLYQVNGYSNTSTEVLIPAFFAAYSGSDPNKVPLTPFPGLKSIRPNWRINYNGDPSAIPWMRRYVQSLSFSHSYKSTYSVGDFETNLSYDADNNTGLSWVRNQLDSLFISQYDISTVIIQEAYSPLISIDIGWVNDLSTSMEINKQRSLSLSLTNNQITEVQRDEFTLGVGYKLSGLDKILKTKKKSEKVSNDVNLRLDASRSNTKTVYRKIVEDDTQTSSGSKTLDLDFSADYMLSDKFTLKLYYKYALSKPYTSSSYETSQTQFGVSFNFSIM